MELAFLVYAISKLEAFTGFLLLMSLLFLCVVFTRFVMVHDFQYRWVVAMILCGGLAAAVPTEKTAWTMVGAYATQKIVLAPETQRIAGKVLKVIEDKLDEYTKEDAKSSPVTQ